MDNVQGLFHILFSLPNFFLLSLFNKLTLIIIDPALPPGARRKVTCPLRQELSRQFLLA
jgi:hypothetical protein